MGDRASMEWMDAMLEASKSGADKKLKKAEKLPTFTESGEFQKMEAQKDAFKTESMKQYAGRQDLTKASIIAESDRQKRLGEVRKKIGGMGAPQQAA